MKEALFYLLQNDKAGSELLEREQMACDLAADAWRLKKRVIIVCEDQQQAFKIDEALWKRDAQEFVPHNLTGENDSYGTPIEISWLEQLSRKRADILISLTLDVAPNARNFSQVIDFVPADEKLKIAARTRYKHYHSLGFELKTEKSGSE